MKEVAFLPSVPGNEQNMEDSQQRGGIRAQLGHFLDSTWELLFPSSCLHCGCRLACRELPLLCDACLSGITFINAPLCPCCGLPFRFGVDHHCGDCLRQNFVFDAARAALEYKEPVSSLISEIKFTGSLAPLATLGHLVFQGTVIKDLTPPDLVLPVPLHQNRLRKRCFNQALLLARRCFPQHRDLIVPDLLIRHRETVPQTGLSGTARRKNLSGAFSLTKPDMVQGKKVLLVDDVFTTGSTVNECAKVVRRAGATRIEVFTVARAV
ncbi:MAG: ComF family protein [Desulfobulbaceae bacterium]